ncbi:MAG: class I SAM-dependent methyltransferase [Planctomycetota bacterium]
MLVSTACLLLSLGAPPQRPVATTEPQTVDPESTPAGRERYLGREIAHTMHWTGAGWLMRRTREDEENGVALRRWLAVRPGQSICDLGCGNGYHTVPLARQVGSGGRMFAVDLQPQMLKMLEQRTDEVALDNVTFVEATVDDPKLPKASCDLVLMVDVYHELSHPVRVLQHVRRALAPGGEVVLVEFRAEAPEVPIKPEHMMSKAQVIREMASHGFTLARETDALPWQHAMAFVAVDERGRGFEPRQLARGLAAALRLEQTVAEEDPAEDPAARPGNRSKRHQRPTIARERVVAPYLAKGVELPAGLAAPPGDEPFAVVATDGGGFTAQWPQWLISMRRAADGRWQVTGCAARTPR